jgi:tetratricopeptide (TPR) repeat protein
MQKRRRSEFILPSMALFDVAVFFCNRFSIMFCITSYLHAFFSFHAANRLGNTAFAAKEFDEAIKHYTAAIAIDSKNCVYYSNRR